MVKGDQRGRTIGFPTLNIVLEKGADPFRGIYAVRVRDALQQGAEVWAGAGYFGDRPTFDTGRTFLEVYLIGFDGDLYGRQLFVEFIDLIRGDKRFASIDELVSQMKADCDAAVKRLAGLKADDPVAAVPAGAAAGAKARSETSECHSRPFTFAGLDPAIRFGSS